MIIYKNANIENELKNINLKDYYILTDFDGTLTINQEVSSWVSIFKNPKVSEDFVDECIKIYNEYHQYEIDNNMDFNLKILKMNEWYEKNIKTLADYEITKEIIDSASNENIKLRDGAKEFLKFLNEDDVPVIIISAGVGNIIKQFLINNDCKFDNIHIISNMLKFENGKVSGVKENRLIHPLNKNEISLPEILKDKIKNKKCLLLGDNIADITMHNTQNDVLKIGFMNENSSEILEEFKNDYDVVCTENTSFDEIFSLEIGG